MKPHVKLRDHQKEALKVLEEKDKLFWQSPTGSGKTLVALIWLNRFEGARLVLTPKQVIPVWEYDDEEFLGHNNIIPLTKGTSRDKNKLMKDTKGDNIFVVNYETARLLDLHKMGFTAVVVDEGHRLGSWNSKQSVQISKKLSKVGHKLIMTGTPYEDGPEMLYGIFRFLFTYIPPRGYPQCSLFGHWDDFLDKYCHTYPINRHVRAISGYKNLYILSEKIKPHALITTDVDLPEFVERVYPIEIENKRAYKSIVEDGVIEFDNDFIMAPHILTKMIRGQQLLCSGVLETINGEIKEYPIKVRVDTLLEILEEIGNEPVVIFTRFKRDVELIQSSLDEEVALLTGDYNNLKDWQDGKYRLLVANIAAGGEGVRLERARHAVFWSIGASATALKQAKGRIRRVNRQDTVFYHYIVSQDSIDEQIYDIINSKNEVRDELDELLK